MSETLLRDITEYCRRTRMAESTFGRLAVNDGKLVSRLRLGGRVTTDTVERVRGFIERPPAQAVNPTQPSLPKLALAPSGQTGERNFRFYDNRQKYLLSVTTCSEQWVIAQRVEMECGTDRGPATVGGDRQRRMAGGDPMVLQQHGALSFLDEPYVISRKRDSG